MTLDLLSELIQRGQEHDKTLRELTSGRADTSQSWPAFIDEVRSWLRECVQHGRYVPEGSADRRALQGQVDYWTSRLLQSEHPLPEFDLVDEFDPNAGRPLPAASFPYFGLIAATEQLRVFADVDRTQRFFGRDEQIKEYVEHLGAHVALLVLSESGGGKSSIAMAGVIPELRRKRADWLLAPRVTPGAHPVAALGSALAATDQLGVGADANSDQVVAALGTRNLLLFVDQLEELLTVCTDELDQAAFSNLLEVLARSERVRLLATMRSDHYDRLAQSQACRPLFLTLTANNSVKTLPPMTFEQIRSVILKPAQVVGLRYIPASLVDQLANETANLPGGLPRLQFALQRLWALRPRDEAGQPLDLITTATFKQLPTVREALGKVAQGMFDGLSPDDQRACERLMLELTVLDDQSEVPLRRRRLEPDLLGVLADAKLAPPDRVMALIEEFEKEGLLVRTGEADARQIEVAHESLFRYWPQFQNWINNDAARSRLKDVRQISRDALQWERAAHSPDYLKLRGVPLDTALGYCAENWLDPLSRRYCEACDAARRTAAKAETTRKWQKLALLWLVITLVVGAVGGGLYARLTAHELDTRRASTANTFASLIGQLDPLEAIDLAYSLEVLSPGNYVVPLVHALDRLTGSKVMGQRDSGADFSTSGWALVQRLPDTANNTKELSVRVYPINPDGSLWPTFSTIKVLGERDGDGTIAALDVGPPIASKPETRLVAILFFKPLENGRQSIFTKAEIYTIGRDEDSAKSIVTYRFDPLTTDASDIAFSSNGTAAILALQQYQETGRPKDYMISFRIDEPGKVTRIDGSSPEKAKSDNGRSVVTAVAFADPAANQGRAAAALVTGRLDGSVFCGKTLVENPDRSPVVRLRVAGPGPAFVALHRSNRLIIGQCGNSRVPPIQLDQELVSLPSLVLQATGPRAGERPSQTEPNLRLSFTDSQKFCSISWPATALPKPEAILQCWTQGLAVDQAVPHLATEGLAANGFLALPNRSRFWVVGLDGGSMSRGTPTTTTEGVPVAWGPRESSRNKNAALAVSLPAASLSGKLARIIADYNLTHVERQTARDHWERVPTGLSKQPIAVAVNDLAALVVLGSDRDLAIVRLGSELTKPLSLAFVGNCLRLSPDGKTAVVAGLRGERAIVAVAVEQTSPVEHMDNLREVPLTACAVANDSSTVSGFDDGTVVYYPKNDKPVELTTFAQFRLPGGIQDVSIDATGRFVAALGRVVDRTCLAGTRGHPIRIWDRQSKDLHFPVASGCLPDEKVLAIGPLAQRLDNRWSLTVFREFANVVHSAEYPCLACSTDPAKMSSVNYSDVIKRAESFQPRRLSREAIKSSYGVEP